MNIDLYFKIFIFASIHIYSYKKQYNFNRILEDLTFKLRIFIFNRNNDYILYVFKDVYAKNVIMGILICFFVFNLLVCV